MEDYCDKKIKIKEAQSIALSEDVFYPRCQTTFEAPHNHVIWFNFHYFDVGRPSVIYCTYVLRIYDGKITFSHALNSSAKIKKRRIIILFLKWYFLYKEIKILTWTYFTTFKTGTRFYNLYFRGKYTVPWTFSQQGLVWEINTSATSYHQQSCNLQIQKHGGHHQYWI